MKYLVCLLSALMMISYADAADKKKDARKAERELKREEREKTREAVSDFLTEKDKNKDGSVKRDEYIAGEADAASAGEKFDKFDKNGDRSLSKSEIAEMLGLK